MDGMFTNNFSTVDWVIVACYLSLSIAIGILANRYTRSVSAYMVGGAAAGTSLNTASYVGTYLGLVTVMYAAQDAFSNGFAYVTVGFFGLFAAGFIGSTGFCVRKLREMKLLTLPEYFERRFSRRTRIVAASVCVLAGVLNMGLFPKMGATFITYATGLNSYTDLGLDPETIVNLITSALIVLVLIYTVLGGMVSVVITDYMQFVVLSVGMGFGVYCCLDYPGLGWSTMIETLAEHRGERMFNPLAPGGYGWVWVIFNIFIFFFATLAWAPEATRTLTARSPSVARKTFLFVAPANFIRIGIPALWAVAAFTLVSQHEELRAYFFPDGLDAAPSNPGQAMPLALGAIVPSGLLGILVAGLMAAFMSTHDSYLLCWSSVIARDIVSPLRNRRLDGRQEIFVTRVSVVVIGLFLLVWGIWYPLDESVWNYMAVTGSVYLSGAGVALIGGIYWKRASEAGAIAAFFAGLVAIAGLFLDPINELSGLDITQPLVGLFSFCFCAIVFVTVSLLVPDQDVRQKQERTAEG